MPKGTQIVCQHLENISREVFENYQDIISGYIRGRHGIYALYSKGKLYYVGLTSNLRGRLRRHLKDKHQHNWDRFSVYLTIDDKAIKELETLLLRIVAPTGNSTGGRFVRSDDLAKQLNRDISERHNAMRDNVLGRKKRRKKAKTKTVVEAVSLPLAKKLTGPIKLRARYKGKRYRATLRKDGMIRFQGELYSSPSAAGAAVRGLKTNGWALWHYERAPGDWIPLAKLRK